MLPEAFSEMSKITRMRSADFPQLRVACGAFAAGNPTRGRARRRRPIEANRARTWWSKGRAGNILIEDVVCPVNGCRKLISHRQSKIDQGEWVGCMSVWSVR